MVKIKNLNKLKKLSLFIRKKIIEISFKKKAHHVGSCLSCVEIMVVLFFGVMNFSKKNLIKNDFFVLSKGHAALIYYIILFKKNFFSEKYLLRNFLSDGGTLGGHPDRNTKLGIDFSSGSLGHGISIGCGVALSFKKDKKKNRVFVLLGDGECNEGMIWESFLFAAQQQLNNLFVVIDYNKMQGLGSTNQIISLSSLKKKIDSFNWNVYEADGHDINDLSSKFNKLISKNNKPNLIIANTVKGKGILSMENKFESHYQLISKNEYLLSLGQLSNKSRKV